MLGNDTFVGERKKLEYLIGLVLDFRVRDILQILSKICIISESKQEPYQILALQIAGSFLYIRATEQMQVSLAAINSLGMPNNVK